RSLLLTSMCCDDTYPVTPRVSALAGCDNTLNRFKMRGFGDLLEACTKADTKHDIGPTCRGKTGGFNQITNKDANILYSLANGINIDYAIIFWEDIIIKLKKHREKVVPYTRFLSLLMMRKMKEGYGDGELTLYPTQQRMATKGGSSKAPIGSKTGHSKKRKESSSAMDSNPNQPPVSTTVDLRMHKEVQQATSSPTSLRVTSEAGANPRLSSGMSTSNLNIPIYSSSFIVHSESASGYDASADSTAEADPGISAPRNEASSIAKQVKEEEASSTIKLEDLVKLVSYVQPSFKDLDSPEDDPVIVVDDSDEDEDDEVHATKNVKTEDTSVPKSSSPRSFQTLQWELPAEFLVVQSQDEMVHAKLKTLDALPSLLNKVINALTQFA
ncbi:hypothetical protein Tco_1169001, partial [Tanacetum coccineum]